MIKKLTPIVLIGLYGSSASLPALAASGEEIYKTTCFVCHATGVANAPKLGDKEAWQKRIDQGIDKVYENSIKGKGAMPPKGGGSNYSDDEIKAAVDYMLESLK